MDIIECPILDIEIWKNVVNFVNEEDVGNLQSITPFIPIEALECICAILSPHFSVGEDLVIWTGDPDEFFSFKGA